MMGCTFPHSWLEINLGAGYLYWGIVGIDKCESAESFFVSHQLFII